MTHAIAVILVSILVSIIGYFAWTIIFWMVKHYGDPDPNLAVSPVVEEEKKPITRMGDFKRVSVCKDCGYADKTVIDHYLYVCKGCASERSEVKIGQWELIYVAGYMCAGKFLEYKFHPKTSKAES